MHTLSALVVVFGPMICLTIGYIYGRYDEMKHPTER